MLRTGEGLLMRAGIAELFSGWLNAAPRCIAVDGIESADYGSFDFSDSGKSRVPLNRA
jgi:hypothetical protein